MIYSHRSDKIYLQQDSETVENLCGLPAASNVLRYLLQVTLLLQLIN